MRIARKPRVGIYAGTFDPVHAGHIGFALQAQQIAELDEVCFMPERRSRYKPGSEHYVHRLAMISQAIRPYPSFSAAEFVDKHFTITRTLPQIKHIYEDCRLVMLMGADVFAGLVDWPDFDRLLRECEVVVSVRSANELTNALHVMQTLSVPSQSISLIDSTEPDISSTKIRQALRLNKQEKGLLPSVERYARQEWLYASLA